MGTLTKYRLDKLDCEIFFETGTGTGASLQHAICNGRFKKFYSCEIHSATYQKVNKIFSNYPAVTIINKDSIEALLYLLPQIDPNKRILFFLDAHFPGETEKEFNATDRKSDSTSLPLKRELKLIHKLRPESDDIIIIDDLRIYEDGDYENGNIPKGFANLKDSDRDLSFVDLLFPNRLISRFFSDDGYMIISPKENTLNFSKLSIFYRAKRSLMKNLRKLFG